MRNSIAISVVAILMAGCGDKVRTVDYYVEHDDERQTKLAECTNDAAKAQSDANCKNVIAAELKLSAGAIRMIQ
ncbi:MAG: EexN family lipoprotein [Paenalcaligenes sp.]